MTRDAVAQLIGKALASQVSRSHAEVRSRLMLTHFTSGHHGLAHGTVAITVFRSQHSSIGLW